MLPCCPVLFNTHVLSILIGGVRLRQNFATRRVRVRLTTTLPQSIWEALPVLGPESAESDITATSRIRTSGSFRLIHIDEYGVIRDLPALSELSSSVRHGYIR